MNTSNNVIACYLNTQTGLRTFEYLSRYLQENKISIHDLTLGSRLRGAQTSEIDMLQFHTWFLGLHNLRFSCISIKDHRLRVKEKCFTFTYGWIVWVEGNSG